jgi:hypothetical protein
MLEKQHVKSQSNNIFLCKAKEKERKKKKCNHGVCEETLKTPKHPVIHGIL